MKPQQACFTEAAPPRPVTFLFGLSLIMSVWATFIGFSNPNLAGNEFRESQTAISAHFIDREGNFSPAYPTPVLGKPWSIPMEFPLFQWAAVGVRRISALSLTEAGRLVSILGFFAAAPAIAAVLRELGVGRTARLIVLSLYLTCPLHVFYARAFLIETAALCSGAWYLAGLLAWIRRRTRAGATVAVAGGIAAGLIKVTTFIVFVAPAFGFCLASLWIHRKRASSLTRAAGALAAIHLLPFGATLGWIRYADAVKRENPAGVNLTSAALTDFNFGSGQRLDPEIWAMHARILIQELAHPLVLVALLILLLLTIRDRCWLKIGILATFLGVQLVFPVLYAWHSYYYMAAGFLLMAALGLCIGTLWERRRHLALAMWAAILALQVTLYFQTYYTRQATPGDEGNGLTAALRSLTAPDDVIVVIGADWNSMIPFFAQRRALMVQGPLERDERYLNNALAALDGEQVTALVLLDSRRELAVPRRRMEELFDLDSQRAFTWRNTDVYLHRQLRENTASVFNRGGFHEVVQTSPTAADGNPIANRNMKYSRLLPHNRALFRTFSPAPVEFFSSAGPQVWKSDDGKERFFAHPLTRLRFELPAGDHRLTGGLEIIPAAYESVPEGESPSDGVEIVVATTHPDGRRNIVQRLYVNPAANPAQRGVQPLDWNFTLPGGWSIEIEVNGGPAGHTARDWALLSPLEIR